MRAWRAESPASKRVSDEGLAEATKMSVMGECSEYGWVPSGGVLPLSWWFLVRLVLASTSSVISSLLVWVKSTASKTMA